ncbi:MAG: hypothetical protein H0T82_02720 [Sphingomonas sp.]|nr:hypothetical protein [Sphingomonas sp.]
MPGESDKNRPYRALRRATALVTKALDLLDAHDGPPEATAHLDLALHELRRAAQKDGES